MSRPIPDIARDMRELATEMALEGHTEWADRLRALADDTPRRAAVRQAPVRSRKVTPQLTALVARFARDNPRASIQEIANRFAVNPGRVSEILNPRGPASDPTGLDLV